MKSYLLPCSCSRRIAVAATQAGGVVRCSDCGAMLQVPRLGELARLETASGEPAGASAGAGGREWNAARAVMLAGVVTALLAATAAGWLRGRRAGVAPIDAAAIMSAVAAAPSDQVHESWLDFERNGIARPPVREEQRRLDQARLLHALEKAAWIVAAAGCLAAVAAALAAGRP